MLHMEGPGESFASIITRILPAASIAASSDSGSVILYGPTYLGFLPAITNWEMIVHITKWEALMNEKCYVHMMRGHQVLPYLIIQIK